MKKEHIKIEQSQQELLSHLKEQIQFIKKSATDFDNGDITEAKRIAVHIRTLVHDTKNSTSLLSQLGIKEKILFLNSALPYRSNTISHTGLVYLKCSNTSDGVISTYSPFLNNGPPIKKERITFIDWWEKKIVLTDQRQNQFTRRDLILNVSNTDGGAHIDGKINKEYAELSRENSVGFVLVTTKQNQPEKRESIKYIELASIRQVAFELLESISRFHL